MKCILGSCLLADLDIPGYSIYLELLFFIAYYDVDYSTVPLSTETDSDDDINQDKVIFRKTMSDQQVKLKRPVLTIAAILAVIGVVIVCIMAAKSYNRTTAPIVLKQHKTTPNWSTSFSVESKENSCYLLNFYFYKGPIM